MKVTIQKIVLVLIVMLSSQLIFSQTPPPPTPPPPPGLPIDGGVVLMFIVALSLGYLLTRKYFITKKSSL
ncbi:PID-CTERM protein-sorting domain-containing protein [Flavobacterium sp.]|uniref:PID-CTERM protein-sorting domain-containing protein n=1 Tax=Flavobacterium sp. TaxID=239 RepID=UPI003D29D43C